MRIVILGGTGNYGLTLAGLATRSGHEATLLQFPGTIRRIPIMPQKNYEPMIRTFERQGGKYEIDDKLLGETIGYNLPQKVLRGVGEIPAEIDMLIIAYPSLLHESIGCMLKRCQVL